MATKMSSDHRPWSFVGVRLLSVALLLFALSHLHIDVTEATVTRQRREDTPATTTGYTATCEVTVYDYVEEQLDFTTRLEANKGCEAGVKHCIARVQRTDTNKKRAIMQCDQKNDRMSFDNMEEESVDQLCFRGIKTDGYWMNDDAWPTPFRRLCDKQGKVKELYTCCGIKSAEARCYTPNFPPAPGPQKVCHKCHVESPGNQMTERWCPPENHCYVMVTVDVDSGTVEQIRDCDHRKLPAPLWCSEWYEFYCHRVCQEKKRYRICCCTTRLFGHNCNDKEGAPDQHILPPTAEECAEHGSGPHQMPHVPTLTPWSGVTEVQCYKSNCELGAAGYGVGGVCINKNFGSCFHDTKHCIWRSRRENNRKIGIGHCDQKYDRNGQHYYDMQENMDHLCAENNDDTWAIQRGLCDKQGVLREVYRCCGKGYERHCYNPRSASPPSDFPPHPAPNAVCHKCKFESPGEQSSEKWCPPENHCYAMVTVDVETNTVERIRDCDHRKLPAPLVCDETTIPCLRVCGEKKRYRVCCCRNANCNNEQAMPHVKILPPTAEECADGGDGPKPNVTLPFSFRC